MLFLVYIRACVLFPVILTACMLFLVYIRACVLLPVILTACVHFHTVQLAIGDPDAGTVAAIILYSDKTTLAGDTKTSSWPICLSLGNIARSKRAVPTGYEYMGRFPDEITNKKHPNYINDNKIRVQIYHECMSLVVATLKANAKRYVPFYVYTHAMLFKCGMPLLIMVFVPQGHECTLLEWRASHSASPSLQCDC